VKIFSSNDFAGVLNSLFFYRNAMRKNLAGEPSLVMVWLKVPSLFVISKTGRFVQELGASVRLCWTV
jgi:hypothetical protein